MFSATNRSCMCFFQDMGKSIYRLGHRLGSALLIVTLLAATSTQKAQGCTIFVLTDGERTLFFNNEDWSNPLSRIWFVRAPEGFYSCVYVGFENNGAEGGMNSAGLAFDWVAGFSEAWTPYPNMLPVGGRTSERMLESCATVEEAIAFYQTYREPQFHRAKILVADKSGASAIIGARDGKLHVDKANHSRGFGYGRKTLAEMLKTNTEPKLEIGREILRACEQKGQYATKYSSVFDLKDGEISIFAAGSQDEVKLNLTKELKRGAHYYDIPKLREQLAAPKPALSNMRSFLREFNAAPNDEPGVTKKVAGIIRSSANGKMAASDFAPELWSQLSPIQEAIRADLKLFGELISAAYIGHSESPGKGARRYKFEFKNAWVLQDFVFDSNGKVAGVRQLGIEWRHPLP